MKLSPIEWADYTFNPWIGCTKVSPGCANCYAEHSTPARTMGIEWGKGKPRHRTSPSNWNAVRSLDRKSAKAGIRTKVFCASLSDWLDTEVPASWLGDLLALIAETPNLDWQLVTKRPNLFHVRMAAVLRNCSGTPGAKVAKMWSTFSTAPKNVWFGITTERQKAFNDLTQSMARIDARIKFLSVEPLLEDIDMGRFRGLNIDWVIVGGESGNNARVADLDWIGSIADQAIDAKIPLFVKQLGSNVMSECGPLKLNHPKGGDILEFPAGLQRREFPRHLPF